MEGSDEEASGWTFSSETGWGHDEHYSVVTLEALGRIQPAEQV